MLQPTAEDRARTCHHIIVIESVGEEALGTCSGRRRCGRHERPMMRERRFDRRIVALSVLAILPLLAAATPATWTAAIATNQSIESTVVAGSRVGDRDPLLY